MDLIDPTSPDQLLSPPRPPEGSLSDVRENPVFNLLDVVFILAVAFVSLVLCGAVALGIAYASGSFRGDIKDLAINPLVFIPAQVVSYVLTVGFMVFLIWVRYRTKFAEAIRWNMPEARIAFWAVAGGAGLALISQIASGLLERWIPKSLPIEQYLRTPSSAYAMAAFGILVAPLVEELFFRGFLYPALARPLGVGPAIALTAGGFAMLHAEQLAHAWVPLLLLFAVGTILTVVRAKTKSVATTVLMHMSYNCTLFTMLYIATQGFRHMERAT